MLAGMAKKKTTFGLTLSNRALVTRGTPPEELIDMAVRAEATGAVDAIWVGDSILSKPRRVLRGNNATGGSKDKRYLTVFFASRPDDDLNFRAERN